MEPKNWWFLDVSPVPRICLKRFHVNFRGCTWIFLLISLDDWFPKVLPKGWFILWQFKLTKNIIMPGDQVETPKNAWTKTSWSYKTHVETFAHVIKYKNTFVHVFWFSSLSTFTVKINTFSPSNISALHKISKNRHRSEVLNGSR